MLNEFCSTSPLYKEKDKRSPTSFGLLGTQQMPDTAKIPNPENHGLVITASRITSFLTN